MTALSRRKQLAYGLLVCQGVDNRKGHTASKATSKVASSYPITQIDSPVRCIWVFNVEYVRAVSDKTSCISSRENQNGLFVLVLENFHNCIAVLFYGSKRHGTLRHVSL